MIDINGLTDDAKWALLQEAKDRAEAKVVMGATAYHRHQPASTNPYPAGSDDAAWWDLGYLDAKNGVVEPRP